MRTKVIIIAYFRAQYSSTGMSRLVDRTLFRTTNGTCTRLFYDSSKADGGCWLRSNKDCNVVRVKLITVSHS
jgi:hypothetical protein